MARLLIKEFYKKEPNRALNSARFFFAPLEIVQKLGMNAYNAQQIASYYKSVLKELQKTLQTECITYLLKSQTQLVTFLEYNYFKFLGLLRPILFIVFSIVV